MAVPSQTTVCYQDLQSSQEDGKMDWTRGTKMPLQVIHIFKHLDIAVSKHQIHHDNYQSVFNQHSYTQVLRLCIAQALNTAWQWSGRFFIHISGFTYNFIYNDLRVSWTCCSASFNSTNERRDYKKWNWTSLSQWEYSSTLTCFKSSSHLVDTFVPLIENIFGILDQWNP